MDYYCSAKFTELQINVQSRLLYNCCKAYPERISVEWMEANPGRLFHTDTMLEDRALMLDNKPCASCHHGCYKYELQGLQSKRLLTKNKQQISNPDAPLKTLQIILSTDCNLACIYCTPQLSSTWANEIEKHGSYTLNGQSIENDSWTTLWSRMKQKSRSTESKFFDLVLNEIHLAKELNHIAFLGGEPLLNNQLIQSMDHVSDKTISITTGLGVSDTRLKSILEKVKGKKIKFNISAESTGKYFEFIRYGLRWSDLQNRIEMISKAGHEVKLLSVLSNLSLLDIHNFYKIYNERYPIEIQYLAGRNFLLPHVMDDKSKKACRENLAPLEDLAIPLLNSIKEDPTDHDRNNLASYLTQLASRRKLPIDFLPKHFLDWAGIDTTKIS